MALAIDGVTVEPSIYGGVRMSLWRDEIVPKVGIAPGAYLLAVSRMESGDVTLSDIVDDPDLWRAMVVLVWASLRKAKALPSPAHRDDPVLFEDETDAEDLIGWFMEMHEQPDPEPDPPEAEPDPTPAGSAGPAEADQPPA